MPEKGLGQEALELFDWLAMFATVRSQDDSKVFARVNRGALRTIAAKSEEMAARIRSQLEAQP